MIKFRNAHARSEGYVGLVVLLIATAIIGVLSAFAMQSYFKPVIVSPVGTTTAGDAIKAAEEIKNAVESRNLDSTQD